MGKKRRPDPDELPDDNFEVVEDDPPPKKRKPRIAEDDEDDEPPRPVRRPVRAIAAEDDEDDEPIPVPKRKKKKKKRAEEPEEQPPNEWAVPLVLMGLGLLMTVVGTVGIARGDPDFGLSAGAAVAFRLLGQVLIIPITIVALMGIGTVMGIEYGTLTSTIRNLAAMGLFIGGLVDVMDWIHLPWFIGQPIIFVIGLGLLMSLFGLDVDEAMFTMAGLNLLSFLLKIALFMVIMMMVHKGMNKPRDTGPGGSGGPGWVTPGDDDLDPDDDPDDDPDAMPIPKGKAKGKTGNGTNPKGKTRPPVPPLFDPDD